MRTITGAQLRQEYLTRDFLKVFDEFKATKDQFDAQWYTDNPTRTIKTVPFKVYQNNPDFYKLIKSYAKAYNTFKEKMNEPTKAKINLRLTEDEFKAMADVGLKKNNYGVYPIIAGPDNLRPSTSKLPMALIEENVKRFRRNYLKTQKK